MSESYIFSFAQNLCPFPVCVLTIILISKRFLLLQITPLPGAWPQKPGSATFPFFGVQVPLLSWFSTFTAISFFLYYFSASSLHVLYICVQPVIVDEKGMEIEGECSGYLCVKSSWPGAFRTLYGDHERYETTYFKPFPGYYFSGDGCSR